MLHPERCIGRADRDARDHERRQPRRPRAAHRRPVRHAVRRHHLRPHRVPDHLRPATPADRPRVIQRPSLRPAAPGYGFADVLAHLRASLGMSFADAALAATERSAPDRKPPPAARMPVWLFEPDGGSRDAVGVAGDDPTPMPSVGGRFDRWAGAAAPGCSKMGIDRSPGTPAPQPN
jgi:hypothetical protein